MASDKERFHCNYFQYTLTLKEQVSFCWMEGVAKVGGETKELVRKMLDASFITNITAVHIHLV